jgi:hypothetical protein
MQHEYLPTVQCPCCKMYYIIRCAHAECMTEADYHEIGFSSKEYISLKMVYEDE